MAQPKPDLAGAKTRLTQEMAAHAAIREQAVTHLKRIAKEGDAQAAACAAMMEELEPELQEWVDAGMPEDAGMAEKAQQYVAALHLRHDGYAAAAHARQTLGEHGEEEDGTAAGGQA